MNDDNADEPVTAREPGDDPRPTPMSQRARVGTNVMPGSKAVMFLLEACAARHLTPEEAVACVNALQPKALPRRPPPASEPRPLPTPGEGRVLVPQDGWPERFGRQVGVGIAACMLIAAVVALAVFMQWAITRGAR